MAEEQKKTKKVKEVDPMKELLKKQKADRLALQQQITLDNYAKIMTALKTINPGKDEKEIIKLYQAQAKELEAKTEEA